MNKEDKYTDRIIQVTHFHDVQFNINRYTHTQTLRGTCSVYSFLYQMNLALQRKYSAQVISHEKRQMATAMVEYWSTAIKQRYKLIYIIHEIFNVLLLRVTALRIHHIINTRCRWKFKNDHHDNKLWCDRSLIY